MWEVVFARMLSIWIDAGIKTRFCSSQFLTLSFALDSIFPLQDSMQSNQQIESNGWNQHWPLF
jgi:hypothetical protein